MSQEEIKKMPEEVRAKVKSVLKNAAFLTGGVLLGILLFWSCSERKDRKTAIYKAKARTESARADSLTSVNDALVWTNEMLDRDMAGVNKSLETAKEYIVVLKSDNDSLAYVCDSLSRANEKLNADLQKSENKNAALMELAAANVVANSKTTTQKQTSTQTKSAPAKSTKPAASKPAEPVVRKEQPAKDNFVQEQKKAEQQFVQEQKKAEQQFAEEYKAAEKEYRDATQSATVTRSVVVKHAIVRTK